MNVSRIKQGLKNPKDAISVISEATDRHFGQIIFKNTAGFKNNLHGSIIRSKLKKNNPLNNSKPPDPRVQELLNTGYFFMGHPFDKSLINHISDKFNELIENEKFSFPKGQSYISKIDKRVFSRQIYEGHKNIPDSVLLLNDEISEFVQQYYRAYFKVEELEYWRNYHVPSDVSKKTEVYSNRWHCDGRPTTSIKLFIYLSDVTEDDGPFHCQSISRTRELVKMGFHDRHNPNIPQEVLEDPKYCKKMIGKKGAAVWCNTELCFHRSDIPAEGHSRDIIQYQFGPSNKPLHPDWFKTYSNPYEGIHLKK